MVTASFVVKDVFVSSADGWEFGLFFVKNGKFKLLASNLDESRILSLLKCKETVRLDADTVLEAEVKVLTVFQVNSRSLILVPETKLNREDSCETITS